MFCYTALPLFSAEAYLVALKATVFKAELQIADLDRNYYQTHALTLAQHPSETDERMLLRLLAFALNAGEFLQFGRGISATDEPDLWARDLTGAIDLWIDLGQPEEKRVRRACGRARQVVIYAYGGTAAESWWRQNAGRLAGLGNLAVYNVPQAQSRQLASLTQRSMQLQCTVQDGLVWLADTATQVQVEPQRWLPA